MAVINPGDVPINENQVDGTELARRLERLYAAFHSQNSSTGRPQSINAGGLWSKAISGGYELYLFDGLTDVEIGKATNGESATGQWNVVTGGINYSGGNVGVNNATPQEKMDVAGNIRITGGNQLKIFNGAGSSSVSIATDNAATPALVFATGGADRLRIASNGVVTIQGITVGTGPSGVTSNSAIGLGALAANTTGTNNTGAGAGAGQAVTTGAGNTFIGASAGSVVTGSNNTVIGRFTGNGGGLNMTALSNHIVLSDGSGNPRMYCDSTGTWILPVTANQTAISVRAGAQESTLKPNAITMNNGTTGIYATSTSMGVQLTGVTLLDISPSSFIYTKDNALKVGGGAWGTFSDGRLKENVIPFTGALSTINKLRPVQYSWKLDSQEPVVGFIAQEVAQVIPNAVRSVGSTPEQASIIGKEVLTIGWQNDMFAYLVGAIQELSAKVDSQELIIKELTK